MIISIKHEMIVFWASFLCGQAVGIIWDFFRSLRKNFCHTRFAVAAEDIVFGILTFKLFFDICYITNSGGLRWYIFASFICSLIIYFCTLTKPIFEVWNFIFKILKAILLPLKKIFVFLSKKTNKLFRHLKFFVSRVFSGILADFVQFAEKVKEKPPETKDIF